MDKIILKAERFDLTGEDIHRITDGKTNIIDYPDLENVNNLEEVLNPYGAVVLLYETKKNFGHWVCLLDMGNKNLEFFDPYGLKVDEELLLSDFHLRQHQGQPAPHLTALIEQGGYNVVSNTKRLQKFLEHTNTCGRWVSLRVRFRDSTLKEFIKLTTKNKCYDGDFWVSAITLLV